MAPKIKRGVSKASRRLVNRRRGDNPSTSKDNPVGERPKHIKGKSTKKPLARKTTGAWNSMSSTRTAFKSMTAKNSNSTPTGEAATVGRKKLSDVMRELSTFGHRLYKSGKKY